LRDGAAELLACWYRDHARALPWRSPPGGTAPDPYHVWLSEIMLQQTTVATVIPYFQRFLRLWPDVSALALAPESEVMAAWAGLGYYSRARNLIAAARILARDGFPETEAMLRQLPGIGPYTAAAIAAIAFDRPAVVVDGNVERVVTRLFALDQAPSRNKPAIRHLAGTLTPAERPGDHAQAMMDLGATICVPTAPICPACPLERHCEARRSGRENALPVRAVRLKKPQRSGRVWVAVRPDGAVLWQRRPEAGLLGGMPGLPTGGWDGSEDRPPFSAAWSAAGEIRHSLTHFDLLLRLEFSRVPQTMPGEFDAPAALTRRLPRVFAKALALALSEGAELRP
jgi:A/G-specific adenine glycosylase